MDKVRIGVVGLGNMGSHHVTYINKLEGAALGAVADVKPERLEKFKASLEVPAFARYQDLIDSGTCDAVLVATPHYQHPEISMAAMSAGLHVLCEKPLAVTVKAARELIAFHERHAHLKFGLMFQTRTNPLYVKMRELIADGELGEVSRITWVATNWFRTWTYYASGGWRATWAGEGGGVLINQNPHNLDLLQWVPGMMPNRVTAVASIARTHPIEVEDEVSAILEYPSGATGHFVTSTGEAPGTDRLEIAGDRGKLVADGGKLRFHRTRKSVREVRETSPESFASPETWEVDVPVRSRGEGSHAAVTQNFVNAVLKGIPLVAEGREGVRGLEIGNAMLLAGLKRRPVDLPLDGDEYDAFLKELTQTYGGKKQLRARPDAVSDVASSFKK